MCSNIVSGSLFLSVLFLFGIFFSSSSPADDRQAPVVLSVHLVHSTIKKGSGAPDDLPVIYMVLPSVYGEDFIVKKTPIFTEKDFIRVSLIMSSQGQGEELGFFLSETAKKRFGDVTRANLGKQIAIVMQGKVISAPLVREPILDGRGVISGGNMRELYEGLPKSVREKQPSTFCSLLPKFFHVAFGCP